VVSWRTRPATVSGPWLAYRQVATDTAPLYHSAGEPIPSQPDGRWHRQGEGYAQYLALEASGAWAELIRYERIRSQARGQEYVRKLWLAYVEETDIADLSTFDRYVASGLDPRLAVGGHKGAQQLADLLCAEGFRGLLSPNAALVGATNLTLFGERYERVLLTNPEKWQNPQPGLRIPCSLVAEAPPPADLITQVCFRGMEHDGYRDFLRAQGLPSPTGTP
jgi:hypothetical protein